MSELASWKRSLYSECIAFTPSQLRQRDERPYYCTISACINLRVLFFVVNIPAGQNKKATKMVTYQRRQEIKFCREFVVDLLKNSIL